MHVTILQRWCQSRKYFLHKIQCLVTLLKTLNHLEFGDPEVVYVQPCSTRWGGIIVKIYVLELNSEELQICFLHFFKISACEIVFCLKMFTLNCRNVVVYIYTNIQIYNEMQNVKHAKLQLFKHKIVLNIIVLTLLDAILI